MKQKQSNPRPQFLLKIALAFLVFFGFSTMAQTVRASFLDDILSLPNQLAEGSQIAITEVFPSFFNQASLASVLNDIQCFFGFNCTKITISQEPITENQNQIADNQKPLSSNQDLATNNSKPQQPEPQTTTQPDQPKTPVQITQIINPTKEIQTIHTISNNTNTVVVDNDTKNQVNQLLRQLNSDRPNYSTGQTVSLPTNLVSKTLNITSGDFNVDENGNVTANDITSNGNLTVQGNFTVSGSQTYSGAASFSATSTVPALLVEQTGSGNALQADNVIIKDSIIATDDRGTLKFQTTANYLDANGNLVLSGDITAGKYNGLTINPTTKSLTVSNDATISGTNTGDQTITLTGDITGSGTGSFATTIGNAKITNAMLAGSIAASKLIGTDIATVGTITTGTWNGTTISPTKGGTGIANGANNTITFTGNYTLGLILSANTSLTLPTSGTLATTSDKLNAFASTSSSELAGTISDETGSGALVFATSPTFATQLTTPKVVGDTTGLYLNEDGGAGIFVKDGGNVGIGNTNPSSKLEVTGDIRIGSGSGGQIIFADGSTMASSGLGSAAALSNTTDAIMTGDSDANNTGAVIFKTGSNDRLHILNNGNVGIGTASPNTKLDVRGGINAGTNGTEFTLSSSGAVVAITYNGLTLTSQATGYTISGGTSSKTLTLDDNLTATTINSHLASTSNPHSVTQSQVGLGSVENTALSTWAGTGNITTVGTLANLNVTNPISGSITGNAATVTGFSLASGKTLTISKTMTLTSADDTSVITLPAGVKTLLAADGNGASLTNLAAGNLSGTISAGVLGNSTVYIGSTAVALNRTTGNLALTGITSIDGNAATVTNGVYINAANSFSLVNPLTTIAESWIGPSNTAGIYFKGGNVGVGTTNPSGLLQVGIGGDASIKYAYLDGLRISGDDSAANGNTIWAGANNFAITSNSGYKIAISQTSDWTKGLVVDTTNGNVGVGTTSPTGRLTVRGANVLSVDVLGIEGVYNGGTRYIAADTSQLGLASNVSARIGFVDSNNYAAHIVFETGPSGQTTTTQERMRIQAGGNVGIGTTNPGSKLEVNGNIAIPSGGRYIIRTSYPEFDYISYGADGTDTWSLMMHAYAAGMKWFTWDGSNRVQRMHLGSDGKLYVSSKGYQPGGGSWADSSDQRLKENIVPITGALNKIMQLQGVNFDWKNPQEHGNDTRLQGGFIAQDVQRIFPNWIQEIDPNGADKSLIPQGEKSLSLSLPFEFDALVVEAIKEQQGQINDLKYTLNNFGLLNATSSADMAVFHADGPSQTIKNVLQSLGMILQDGVATLKEVVADSFTAKQANIEQIQNNQIQTKQIQTEQMCITGSDGQSVCINKDQLKDLIQKAGSSVTINQTYQTPAVSMANGTTTETGE